MCVCKSIAWSMGFESNAPVCVCVCKSIAWSMGFESNAPVCVCVNLLLGQWVLRVMPQCVCVCVWKSIAWSMGFESNAPVCVCVCVCVTDTSHYDIFTACL